MDLSNECRHLYQDNLKEKKMGMKSSINLRGKTENKIQNERIHKGLKIFN